MVELLFCPKCLRRGFVAHLDEILHRKIGEGVGIFFSPREIFREDALSISGEFGQAFVEDDAIFEGGVHSLAVKRYDSVGGVADKRDLVFVKPRGTTNGDERASRVCFEIVEQRRHEWDSIRKFFIEKAAYLVVGLGSGEATRPFEFPKI